MTAHEQDVHPDGAVQRRRGRPQRLPYDVTPSNQLEVDHVRRTAWLFATTRLLSPATADMSRTQFIESARDLGLVLDAPRLSRWESGTTAAPSRLVTAYEHLAELPRGSLRATCLMVQRLGRAARVPQVSDPITETEVDDLFNQAMAGTATGDVWLDLATELSRFERIYIPADAWTALSTCLVNELTRAVGISLLRRYEAAALLMQHPTARRHLTRCLGVMIMDPDVQNAAPALSLLSEVGDEAAGELVVRLFGTQNRPLQRATLGVAASMAARDLLSPTSHDAVESVVANELRRLGERPQAAVELVTQLPGLSYERVVAAMPDTPLRKQVTLARAQMELVAPDLARTVAETVASRAEATHARAAHDPDQMLRKLVREGLFHAGRDRRYLAATMVAISPYARGTSHALLRLTQGDNQLVAARAWAMLGRFGHVVGRDQLYESLRAQHTSLHPRAYRALGLMHGRLEDGVADRLLEVAQATPGQEARNLSHAATFALGMTGHPHVHHLAAHDTVAVSRAGRWWLTTGAAVRDPDTILPPA